MLGGLTAKGIASTVIPSSSVPALLELPSITSALAFLELSSTNSVMKSTNVFTLLKALADGSSKIYLVFNHMLKDFNREDVETLWKLVKVKHGSTRPEEGYERVLWGDLKVMFDPHIEDEVWKLQQRYSVVRWTLFNSC
nr:hypothetical protein [Tanacetum cinerariifolium]